MCTMQPESGNYPVNLNNWTPAYKSDKLNEMGIPIYPCYVFGASKLPTSGARTRNSQVASSRELNKREVYSSFRW
jgi:hypothetical protein